MTSPVRLAVSAVISISLTVSLAAGTTAMSVATPAAPDVSQRGLFGSEDPTFDGVLRQSWAIIGLAAVDANIPPSAVRWLRNQQCRNGAFEAFRVRTSAPCKPGDPMAYNGIDADSTAMAAMALHAAGHHDDARRAVNWLLRHQDASGGWAWILGMDPGATSTGLAMTALRTVTSGDRGRAAIRDGRTFLQTLSTGCDAPRSTRGALRYSATSPSPDPMSTSQGLLGLTSTLPVGNRKVAFTRGCEEVTFGAVHWSRRILEANAGRIPDAYTPGAIDWNSTAIAALGSARVKGSAAATAAAAKALRANIDAYVAPDATDRPAALGTLLALAGATGDLRPGPLVTRLLATQR